MSELIIGMGNNKGHVGRNNNNNKGHVGRNIDRFQGIHGGLSSWEGIQEEGMPLEFCDARHLCIANTWFR